MWWWWWCAVTASSSSVSPGTRPEHHCVTILHNNNKYNNYNYNKYNNKDSPDSVPRLEAGV